MLSQIPSSPRYFQHRGRSSPALHRNHGTQPSRIAPGTGQPHPKKVPSSMKPDRGSRIIDRHHQIRRTVTIDIRHRHRPSITRLNQPARARPQRIKTTATVAFQKYSQSPIHPPCLPLRMIKILRHHHVRMTVPIKVARRHPKGRCHLGQPPKWSKREFSTRVDEHPALERVDFETSRLA